jgi:hypothetical protein
MILDRAAGSRRRLLCSRADAPIITGDLASALRVRGGLAEDAQSGVFALGAAAARNPEPEEDGKDQ